MSQVALIIIDMQAAYFNDPELRKAKESVIENCNQLIAAAEKYRVSIYNVRTEHAPDGSTWTLNMKQDGKEFLLEGSDEVKTVEGLDVSRAEDVVKTRDSAFFGTSLHDKLRTAGTTHIILCGVSTQSCISQTAADAYAANIEVTLATEAIASHDPKYHAPTLKLHEKEYRQKLASIDLAIEIMASAKS